MPRAVALVTRREIVSRHRAGESLARIAAGLGLPWGTVRDLWRAYRDRGEPGLAVGYGACGGSTPRADPEALRLACRLKREHPTWGGGRVRVEMSDRLDPSPVPSTRRLQRAFQAEGVNRPRRPTRPRPPGPGPKGPTTFGGSTPSRRRGSRPARR